MGLSASARTGNLPRMQKNRRQAQHGAPELIGPRGAVGTELRLWPSGGYSRKMLTRSRRALQQGVSLLRRTLNTQSAAQQLSGDGMPLKRTTGRVLVPEQTVSFAASAFASAVHESPAQAAQALRVRLSAVLLVCDTPDFPPSPVPGRPVCVADQRFFEMPPPRPQATLSQAQRRALVVRRPQCWTPWILPLSPPDRFAWTLLAAQPLALVAAHTTRRPAAGVRAAGHALRRELAGEALGQRCVRAGRRRQGWHDLPVSGSEPLRPASP